MFIYKITILTTNQVYIGLDTKPSYKLARWKHHCRAVNGNDVTKLYNAMRKAGVENCIVNIEEDGFSSISSLAVAEITYIKKYNSYINGLNSTPGGDGMGYHTLNRLNEFEIDQIKAALGDNFRYYNKNVKWANTTVEERKELTKHLHNKEVYQKKSDTLKEFYKANPDERAKKRVAIDAWIKSNREQLLANNLKASLKGAAKTSIAILVESPDGSMLHYKSKSEFNRQTTLWAKIILEKTAIGKSHKGYKAWEIKDE